jgi:16S rRNA (adenine1518-N6/adenine1519-N6)-dimethyltransferase
LKRLGQNFLLDHNLLAAIVRDAEVQSGDEVLEIGPGPGLLTRHLLDTGAFVRAIEIDAAMERVATDLVEPRLREGGRLRWVQDDALAGSRRLSPALLSLLPGTCRLVANLPYGVAAPLLMALARESDAPPLQVVMIQKELAERLSAGPGGRDYGPLAVLAALTCDIRSLRKVPPGAFWPVPKVQSVVLRLERKSSWPGKETLERLEIFLALAFHNRRKTLLNSVAERAGLRASEVQALLGLKEKEQKKRAEAFEALQLEHLARKWADHAPGERPRPWPVKPA